MSAKFSSPLSMCLPQGAKVTIYLTLWYVLNVQFNIYNKKLLTLLPLPWMMSLWQLGVGVAYVLLVWALRIREAPQLSADNVRMLTPNAFLHLLGHVCTIISLSAGAVSFTHIVKSGEPFFAVVMSAVIMKSTFPPLVYATLLPVVAGVSLASCSELSFSWISFLNAMVSNSAFAARGILSKRSMDKPKGKNMGPANLFAVLTIISFCLLLPVALALEGQQLAAVWQAAVEKGHTDKELLTDLIVCGLCYYLYNEVAFMVLNQVHPVTQAIANTMKRVVIIMAGVIVFQNPVTWMGMAGSAMAVVGVLLYSLAKQYCDKQKANEQSKRASIPRLSVAQLQTNRIMAQLQHEKSQ